MALNPFPGRGPVAAFRRLAAVSCLAARPGSPRPDSRTVGLLTFPRSRVAPEGPGTA